MGVALEGGLVFVGIGQDHIGHFEEWNVEWLVFDSRVYCNWLPLVFECQSFVVLLVDDCIYFLVLLLRHVRGEVLLHSVSEIFEKVVQPPPTLVIEVHFKCLFTWVFELPVFLVIVFIQLNNQLAKWNIRWASLTPVNVLAVKWCIEYQHWHIGDATDIHKVLVVSRESAVYYFVLQNLQQPNHHEWDHIHEVLQHIVALHFKPVWQSRSTNNTPPLLVRLHQLEGEERVIITEDELDEECEFNDNLPACEQLAQFIRYKQPSPAWCLVVCLFSRWFGWICLFEIKEIVLACTLFVQPQHHGEHVGPEL